MKKILYGIFSLIALLALMFSLSSCTECAHIDSDDDLKCDKCGADFDDGEDYQPPKKVNVTFTVKVKGGDALSGVKFTLTRAKSEKSFTTAADGRASAELEVGKYEVECDTETLPEYHILDTYEITLTDTASEVTIEIKDNTPDGSLEKPFFLSEKKNAVDIAAGKEVYYSFHGTSDAHLEVRAENIVVTYDKKEYTPEGGVVKVMFSESVGTAVKFSVKNNAASEASVEIELVSPLGSRDNPIELDGGSKVVPLEKGASIHYKWTAPKSGILVVKSENKNNNIGLTNLNTNAVAAQTFGAKAAYLTVSAGDEVLVAVSSTINEATEIDMALGVYSGTEADPLPVLNDKIDISLAPGASFTFSAEAGKTVTTADKEITIKIGSDTFTPDSLGMISETLAGTGVFTVTNTSDEQNGIEIEIE